MRTRNKAIAQSSVTVPATTSSPVTLYSTAHSPTTWSGTEYGTYPTTVYPTDVVEEMMQDGIGNYPRPSNVIHTKILTKLLGAENRTTSPAGSYAGYRVITGDLGSHYSLAGQTSLVNTLRQNALTGEIPGVTISWAQQDDRKAVQSLYDRARKPVVEGLVNLAEAHEIPGAIDSLSTYAPYLGAKWSKMQSSLLKAKKAARHGSGQFLAYSFGIAPLITDINKVRTYMDRVRKDYERFARGVTKTASSTYMGSYAFSKANTGTSSQVISYQGFATVSPVTRYVLRYREKNPYTTEFISKLDFLLRRFGAAGPASYAWERIPFSFVIDWFIDTTSVISFLDDRLQSDRIETLSLTKSNKYACTTEVFRDIYRTDTNAVVYSGKQGSITHSRYERSVIGKDGYVAPAERYGKKQVALSVALLLQRLIK